MPFDAKEFSSVILWACVRVARTSGFRRCLAPDQTKHHTNTPPEQHIVGVAVQALLGRRFRVMPKIIAREVWRAAKVKKAYRSKKGHRGRFDLVAWNGKGRPVAALKVKPCYGNPLHDLENLAALALAKVGCGTFLCLYAPELGEVCARARLEQRLQGLRARVRLGEARYRTTEQAQCFERGIGQELVGFAAVMVEVLGLKEA